MAPSPTDVTSAVNRASPGNQNRFAFPQGGLRSHADVECRESLWAPRVQAPAALRILSTASASAPTDRIPRPDGASRAMDSRLVPTRGPTRSESPNGQCHNESDQGALKTAPNPMCIAGQCRRSSQLRHPTRRKCDSEERPDSELATRGRCQAARATGSLSRASAASTPTLMPSQRSQPESRKRAPNQVHRKDGKELRPRSR